MLKINVLSRGYRFGNCQAWCVANWLSNASSSVRCRISAQSDRRRGVEYTAAGIDVYRMDSDADVLWRQQTSLLSVESDYKVPAARRSG